MLSSYPVACPHKRCVWEGSLVPSLLRGGESAEVASMQRAWFSGPRCQRDWEMRITDDKVTVLPPDEGEAPRQALQALHHHPSSEVVAPDNVLAVLLAGGPGAQLSPSRRCLRARWCCPDRAPGRYRAGEGLPRR